MCRCCSSSIRGSIVGVVMACEAAPEEVRSQGRSRDPGRRGSSVRSSVVITAIDALLGPLLGALERVSWVQRHLYPPWAPRLAEELAPFTEAVATPLRELEATTWPENVRFVPERLGDVSRQTLE